VATLSARLGLRPRRPNALQRLVRRVASTTLGARVFSRLAPPVDRALARLAGGRTLAELAAGLPTVLVTTTGARSGRPRTVPLAAIPAGAGVALVGTNFGGPRTPAWYANLRRHPEAVVAYRRRSVRVVAREAVGAEREAIMATARSVYAGYAAYEQRITGRAVHVMVLEVAGADAASA
jgi:deazaflavin-dependent oxidoreductase (nitroreductase family)